MRGIALRKQTKEISIPGEWMAGEAEFVFGSYPGGAAGGDTGRLEGFADGPVALLDCLQRNRSLA